MYLGGEELVYSGENGKSYSSSLKRLYFLIRKRGVNSLSTRIQGSNVSLIPQFDRAFFALPVGLFPFDLLPILPIPIALSGF